LTDSSRFRWPWKSGRYFSVTALEFWRKHTPHGLARISKDSAPGCCFKAHPEPRWGRWIVGDERSLVPPSFGTLLRPPTMGRKNMCGTSSLVIGICFSGKNYSTPLLRMASKSELPSDSQVRPFVGSWPSGGLSGAFSSCRGTWTYSPPKKNGQVGSALRASLEYILILRYLQTNGLFFCFIITVALSFLLEFLHKTAGPSSLQRALPASLTAGPSGHPPRRPPLPGVAGYTVLPLRSFLNGTREGFLPVA